MGTPDLARDSWNFSEGDRITDQLQAMRRLGGGAAYEAYLAFDEHTWGPVVVKVIRPTQITDESSLRGLRREVRALDTVGHPSVVRGLRHVPDGERPHLVLEMADGPRLSSLIRRYGPLQEAQYLPLAVDLCSAMQYFRNIGVVHLDIKPSNIIMGAPARLIDLSVARTVSEAAELRHPIGTDAYMAPEQCEPPSTGVPGPASDVWGIGATLFEAIAGYRAFGEGDPKADLLVDRFPQTSLEPAELPDRVPAPVVKAVMSALDPDPAARPTPAEFSELVEPVLSSLPRGRLSTGLQAR